jgi:hypothetical protein
MEESSREVESDPGTGTVVLLVLGGREAAAAADSADKVSEECGRTLPQVERAVWSTGQLLFSELWSTGHLSADIVVGGEDKMVTGYYRHLTGSHRLNLNVHDLGHWPAYKYCFLPAGFLRCAGSNAILPTDLLLVP